MVQSSQAGRRRDSSMSVCFGVCRSVCVCHCVCLCQPVHADRPPTDRGNVSWGGKWTTGRGGVNDPCQNNWLPCRTQWWHHTSSDWLKMIPIHRSVFDAVPLAMQAYLNVGYGQRWIDKSLYCATFDRCEPVWVRHYTHGFSVETKRNDNASCHRCRAMTVMGALEACCHTIGRCHVALHGRLSSSFDCQRCRNAAQVNKLRSSG